MLIFSASSAAESFSKLATMRSIGAWFSATNLVDLDQCLVGVLTRGLRRLEHRLQARGCHRREAQDRLVLLQLQIGRSRSRVEKLDRGDAGQAREFEPRLGGLRDRHLGERCRRAPRRDCGLRSSKLSSATSPTLMPLKSTEAPCERPVTGVSKTTWHGFAIGAGARAREPEDEAEGGRDHADGEQADQGEFSAGFHRLPSRVRLSLALNRGTATFAMEIGSQPRMIRGEHGGDRAVGDHPALAERDDAVASRVDANRDHGSP